MSHKTFIYTRVSTIAQDHEAQMIGITGYIGKHGITGYDLASDTISGATTWRGRLIAPMLESAQAGDLIIVAELSRIGRNTGDVLQFLAEAVKKGVRVVAVKNSMEFDGSIQSKILSTVMGLAAEIERDFISLRTLEGLAAARARGVKLGRKTGSTGKKKLDYARAEIVKLHKAGVSKCAISRLMGCNRITVARFLKSQEPPHEL